VYNAVPGSVTVSGSSQPALVSTAIRSPGDTSLCVDPFPIYDGTDPELSGHP